MRRIENIVLWNVPQRIWVDLPTCFRNFERISDAARRVNVIKQISDSRSRPDVMERSTKSAIVVVLPDPAPAITRKLLVSWLIILFCSSVKFIGRT